MRYSFRVESIASYRYRTDTEPADAGTRLAITIHTCSLRACASAFDTEARSIIITLYMCHKYLPLKRDCSHSIRLSLYFLLGCLSVLIGLKSCLRCRSSNPAVPLLAVEVPV